MNANLKIHIFLFLFLLGIPTFAGSKPQRSTVLCGKDVRFTVLTDGTIRMEWSPTGTFVDAPSFVAINRNLPVPNYTMKDGAWLTIATSKMVLKYKKNSGKFSDKNLVIKSVKGIRPFVWKPGTKQVNNLKGTYRTLDGYDGEYAGGDPKRAMPIEDGLISTDGWTLIDDSQNFLFDNSDWAWVKTRPSKDGLDWYFMAYGHDYKSALKDYTTFAGKIPLPPRYAFGYWWSRYWNYSDKELRSLVSDFEKFNIPLDVLVIDMDWHYTEKGKGGWTGYTWNPQYFPDHSKFLAWTNEKGIKTTMNLHPADGVASYEEKYPEMAKWMNVDTTQHATIPWISSDKHFITGVFKNILEPMEKDGVDFWWLDWQQTPYDSKVKNLSNTWWLNYVFFTYMQRNRETRPMLYHRWGGLGNHRYQIGFSGDTFETWNSLAFQPYFTTCASNVLYSYWSHDLGGHMLKDGESFNPELYTRWMQFGALSPIMRTHSSKNPTINKEIWNFRGDMYEALRNAVLLRHQLVPYTYTMARKAYDTGISLCRPLYYDYPEAKDAYEFKSEYMFGDNMLVSPITAPMKNGYSKANVWLPSGSDWFEWQTGTLLKGGQTINRSFSITEYPMYVKAGAILPLYTDATSLTKNDNAITLGVFPGGDGEFTMYEDNGDDKVYATEYATTKITSTHDGNELKVVIAPRQGNYKDMPTNRQFSLKLYGSRVPLEVDVNGLKVDFQYIGEELAVLIPISEINCNTEKDIRIKYENSTTEINNGMVGQFKHLTEAITDVKFHRESLSWIIRDLGNAEETSINLTYHPEQFEQLINNFCSKYNAIPQLLKDHQASQEDIDWFMHELGE